MQAKTLTVPALIRILLLFKAMWGRPPGGSDHRPHWMGTGLFADR